MQKFRSGRYMYCVIHHVRCHVFTIHSLFTPGPAAPNERLPISLPLRIAGEQILRSLLEKEKTFSNLYFALKKKGFGNVRLGRFQVQLCQHFRVPHRRRRHQLYTQPAERHGEVPAHWPEHSQ